MAARQLRHRGADGPLPLGRGDPFFHVGRGGLRLALLRLVRSIEPGHVPEVVLRQVHHDAEQPGLERSAAPSHGAVAGVDERALRQILGVVSVPREAPRDGENRPLVAPHEGFERPGVPGAERGQQLGVARVTHPTGLPLERIR